MDLHAISGTPAFTAACLTWSLAIVCDRSVCYAAHVLHDWWCRILPVDKGNAWWQCFTRQERQTRVTVTLCEDTVASSSCNSRAWQDPRQRGAPQWGSLHTSFPKAPGLPFPPSFPLTQHSLISAHRCCIVPGNKVIGSKRHKRQISRAVNCAEAQEAPTDST